MAARNKDNKIRYELKMNILIVTLFPLERNTSVANSSISIINGLLQLKHNVTIVMPEWPTIETNCDLNQLRVIRIPGQPNKPYSNWFLSKLHSHFDFLDLTRGYMKHIKDVQLPNEYFDIVLSFSDPKASHVFTAELLKKKKIKYGKWIQHWGDPILGDITRNFWWPQRVIKWYERNLIGKADKSVYVTPFTYKMLMNAYLSLKNKLAFVPLPAEMLPIVEPSKTNVLKISYLGDYNPRFRNLRPLYDACADICGVRLTMAGHGPKYPEVDNVTQLPRIPQQQANLIENESDVIACVCNRSGTQIPGKIMYKTSTNKHILVAVEQDRYVDMVNYLKSFNRFIICQNTIESIRSAIENIRNMDEKTYTTPKQLLPVNIAKEILI